ncbi:MAG: hypothetical protein HY001_02165 [Candidatus Portnoybacteria bacterium]|nr:hypothetical protein [Candidatus Portnoybacteria bacterium]
MTTMTLPKTKYEMLKQRAALYQQALRTLPELKWGIEEYSFKRVKEFMRQDRIDKKTQGQLKKLLASLE